MKCKANRKVLCGAIFLAGIALPVQAQKLERVASFWGFNGVEFLPGGYVQEYSDDDVTQYRYRNSRFVRFKGKTPSLPKSWVIADADFIDHIDLSRALPAKLRALIPRQARVKKFYRISLPGDGGRLAVLCFTKRREIEDSNPQDVFIMAALQENPPGSPIAYRRLWIKKAASETNYQDFQYHVVPGLGAVFLLYTEGVSGDALAFSLDVLRLRVPQ